MRNIKKEIEWQKNTYKRVELKYRKDDPILKQIEEYAKSQNIAVNEVIKTAVKEKFNM